MQEGRSKKNLFHVCFNLQFYLIKKETKETRVKQQVGRSYLGE